MTTQLTPRLRDLLAQTEQGQAFLDECDRVQASPPTDDALLERMLTDARTWTNAVLLQYERLNVSTSEDHEWLRHEVDFHFLLMALNRLRRAVLLAARVPLVTADLRDAVARFDEHLPMLKKLRNVGEHFDDYTVGAGRHCDVKRFQLQVSSWDLQASPGPTWRWLNEEINACAAAEAAGDLLRSLREAVAYKAACTRGA